MMFNRIVQFFVWIFICNATLALEQHQPNKTNIYKETQLNVVVDATHPAFTLQLKSNPTTGYSWFLREYSRHLIQPIKHRFQAPNSGLVGAPGIEYWTFQVKNAAFIVPQSTVIRLIYSRPWQGLQNSKQLVFRVTTVSARNVQN